MPFDRNKQSSYVNAPKYMFGPSMQQQGLYELLAKQIAGDATAMGGMNSMGMGTAESAMGGPAGMLMALPMQYLSGMHNQAQDAINAFTGMPSPIRKDPMRQIGAFLDQFTQRNTPMSSAPMGNAIGNNDYAVMGSNGPIGTVGATSAMTAGNPGAWAAMMGAAMPGAGSKPFERAEPDADEYGGKSDMDKDNYEDANMAPPSPASKVARAQVDRMVAASPVASARPVGGFSSSGLASLLSGARSTQPSAMRGAAPYRPEAMRDLDPSLNTPASIPSMRMSSVPSAASMVGSRSAPSPQYSVQDVMSQSDPAQKTRMRHMLLQKLSGGGF